MKMKNNLTVVFIQGIMSILIGLQFYQFADQFSYISFIPSGILIAIGIILLLSILLIAKFGSNDEDKK
jgi:fucose 4-O-acetylase-like acetyltransferase